jgi:hypothetical protein
MPHPVNGLTHSAFETPTANPTREAFVRIARSLETPTLFSHCIFSDRQGLKKEPRHHGNITIGGNLKGLSMHLEVRELLKGKGRSFVLMLILLAVVALVGCGSPETKVTADDVVQDALAAQAGVSTSHVDLDIDASVVGKANGSDLNVTLKMAANSDVDWANKKMKAHADMTVGYNGMPIQMSSDMYAVDNCSYTQTTTPFGTDNWTKSSLPMDFWFTPDNAQFINSILQSTEAQSLPNEKVGGVNCYVLELHPDVAAIQQMLSQQSSDVDELPDMANLISNLSFKVWVAKDTSFVTKIEIALSAHVPSEVLGEAADGTGLDITLTITMETTKFNQSVSVDLPAEAQNAEDGGGFELPTGMFGF